jgi:hypothetical protein
MGAGSLREGGGWDTAFAQELDRILAYFQDAVKM